MRRTILAVLLSFIVWLIIPVSVEASASTPRGFVLIDPTCCEPTTDALGIAAQNGLDFVTIPLDAWSSVTPSDLEPKLTQPFWHVALRTAGNANGYDRHWIRNAFEQPRQDGRTWAELVTRYQHIEWILIVGNEPSIDWPDVSAWEVRWAGINIYKELAYEFGWKQNYPALKYALSVGTTIQYRDIQIQWLPEDGGARDYYDYINVHLYGHDNVFDGGSGDWWNNYQFFIQDQYTKAIVIGEMGINNPNMSKTEKTIRYRNFVNSQPNKLRGASVFIAGHINTWPQYSMDQYQYGQILGDHWRVCQC